MARNLLLHLELHLEPETQHGGTAPTNSTDVKLTRRGFKRASVGIMTR